MRLSVVVPAYNEEENLEKNIKKYYSYLTRQNYDFEIIIVNDGSKDNTEQISQNLSDNFSHITLLNKEKNQGKGAAIRDGLLAGQGDFLLFLDADNASSIDNLGQAWPLLKDCDLVIGSRSPKDAKGARQEISQNFIKRTLGIFGNKLIRTLTIKDIYDTQCGFKIFTKKSVDSIVAKTKINRWAIDIEILIIAKKQNLKIGIIPIVWKCGKKSRVGARGYLIALKELLFIKINNLNKIYD